MNSDEWESLFGKEAKDIIDSLLRLMMMRLNYMPANSEQLLKGAQEVADEFYQREKVKIEVYPNKRFIAFLKKRY